MNNLMDIQNQIEKLQKQASDIKAKEFDKTVQEIVLKMQAFGITPKDLKASTGRGKTARQSGPAAQPRGKARKKAAGTVAAKYRGPNGEAWSGRGLTPRWLAALLTEGKKKEDFVIPS